MQELSPVHVALGRAIRRRRESAQLSQIRLAELAGCTANYLSLVELGAGNVSLSKLLGIARALRTTAASLVQEAEDGAR